jgi:3-oxoacyl-[acyl-carrier-protein] synthase II
MSARIAITGFGAVTPVGNDAESTWQGLVSGKSGIRKIQTFDASTYPVQIAGMVEGFDLAEHVPDESLRKHLSRAGGFAVAAAMEALDDAGLRDVYEPFERGVSLGGSVGRTELQEMSDILNARKESRENGGGLRRWDPDEVFVFDQNMAPAAIAQMADCRGPMVSVSTACTGSAHAIGEAMRRIQDGEAKMMLAGGYDSLTSWLDVLGFSLLGALTKDYNDDPQRASRPFERDRSGFVLGEGAVLMVLEDLEEARARGAPLLAEIVGYAASLNAYRMTDPPPDGGGAVIAVGNALRESGFRPEDVDYVVAHGTGTPAGDASETTAIKRAFGEHAYNLAVTSPKSMVGHTTCAAGALNMLAAIGAMRESVISPTINYDNPDPELDLDFVGNEARQREVNVAVTNAFAFGGTNGALVVCKPDLKDGEAP